MDTTKEVMIFLSNIKLLRKQSNISQKNMAKILNIGVRSLSKMENGYLPKRLGVSVILTSAKYFNVKISDLFKNMK